jgi:hypothetical protein
MGRPVMVSALLAVSLIGCEGTDSDPGVELTWLSNTTWLIRVDGATVFADAALSRWDFAPPDLARPESFHPVAVASDTALVDEVLDALPLGTPAFVLVGHGHPDHTIDLGLFTERSGAQIIGSRTACYQAQAQGLPAGRCRSVEGGEVIDLTPRLRIRVIRWTHSGNPSDRLGRFIQAPKELTTVPEKDAHGRLGQAPWEAYPNGGGARAYLFTYRSDRSLLRWLVSDTGNPFTFDSVPRIGPGYLADVGVDLSHLDLSGADGTPRQWLTEALGAEGADSLDLWLGYGNVGHVRQMTQLVSVRTFIPHHWGGYLDGFRPGIVRPYDRPALTAYLDSAGVQLAPQTQYMERYRLDQAGLTRLDSDRLRARLGLQLPRPPSRQGASGSVR